MHCSLVFRGFYSKKLRAFALSKAFHAESWTRRQIDCLWMMAGAATLSIRIHGRDRRCPRADAAHFQANHFEVEGVEIVLFGALGGDLARDSEFPQENLAEVRHVENVAEGCSGSAADSIHQ
jgi:hypothetical protein